jgi:tetratricopeptide (TPR) repeat protein
MEGITVGHGNRLTLRSSAFREHILHRLLPDNLEAARTAVVERLAGALDRAGAAEESLRQLLVLRRWQDLERLLADPTVFDGMVRRARQQLRSYWARLHEASLTSRVSIYRAWSAVAPPRRRAEAASLAEDLGDPDTAQALAETVVADGPGDPFAFASSALTLARLAEARGEFAAAEARLATLEVGLIHRALPEVAAHAAVQRARMALARLGPQAAREAVTAAAVSVREGGDYRLRAILLETGAAIHLDLGDFKSAAADYKELVATGERLTDLAVLAAGEAGLGKSELQRGRLRAATESARRALRFARIAGDDRILQDALGISARIAIESGDLDRAGELIRQRRALTERLGDFVGRLEADVDYARWCALLGDAAEAERIIAAVNSTAQRYGLHHLAARLLSLPDSGT